MWQYFVWQKQQKFNQESTLSKMETAKTVGISLALGDLYSRDGVGPLIHPLDGAIARFRALTRAINPLEPHIIVCSAGYCRQDPTRPQPHRHVSLAGQLAKYVRKEEGVWVNDLVSKPLCWSTRSEVRVGIKLAQRLGFAKKEEKVTVMVASNFSHLFRIWLYTELYTPGNWKVRLVRAHHKFSLVSHLLEFPKIIRDLLYIHRVLARLKRIKSKFLQRPND